jgi:hypothetical protein
VVDRGSSTLDPDHPAEVLLPWNWATSAGRYSSDEAKMTGMTPAMFTLIGM